MLNLRIIPLLLIFQFAYLSSNYAQVGCNPELTIEPAFDCVTASNSAVNGTGTGFVCDLEGFCYSTANVPQLNPPLGFCTGSNFVLNNPIWFSFYVNSTGMIDIDIYPSNCNGGIQWAIYQECGSLYTPLACQGPPIPADQPFNISVTAQPNQLVFLVIDGANGATCTYEFDVNEGLDAVYVEPATNTSLSGGNIFCPGAAASFSFSGFQFATDYEWSFDGSVINSNGATANYNIPDNMAPGTYQLCASGVNDCDEIGESLCWDITILPEPEVFVDREVCTGDQTIYYGNSYSAGSYDFVIQGPGSCDTTHYLTVIENPDLFGPTINTAVCDNADFIEFDGNFYYSGLSPNEIIYQSLVTGCDSTVTLYVLPYDDNVMTSSNPTTLPCEGGQAVLTIQGLLPTFNSPPVSFTFAWFGPGNVSLGSGMPFSGGCRITVTQPGIYTVKVTTIVDNPDGQFGNGITDQFCDKTYTFVVGASNSTLTAPILNLPQSLCAGNNYTFTVDNPFPAGTNYTWDVDGGTIIGNPNQSTITVSFTDPGTYIICSNGSDGCGPGPVGCDTIRVSSSPQISAIIAANAVCGATSSLDATITSVINPNDPLISYNWSVISGPNIPGVSFGSSTSKNTSVDVTDFGTYTFTLNVDYDASGCGETDTVTITFEQALVLSALDSMACNNSGQALPFVVDLNGLISGNIGFTGTWSLTSGSPPPAGTPDMPDFTGLNGGTNYVFTFTPNQTGVCPVNPVNVNIGVINCQCPSILITPTGGTYCNDKITAVNLATFVNTGTEPGSWRLTQKPNGSTLTLPGSNILDFNGVMAGTYVFTFTLDNTMANCDSNATTSITVVAAPTATLKDGTVCNADPQNIDEDILDFSSLITAGQTNGTWAYTGSVPASDPASGSFPLKNFNLVTPGTYQYSYTITGDPSCEPQTYQIDIIVEDCACPSAATQRTDRICNNNAAVDLDVNYKITSKTGKWAIVDAPAGSTASISSNNLFNANNTVFGDYLIEFTLDTSFPGCDDTSLLVITIDTVPSPGIPNDLDVCLNSGSSIDLDTLLSGQQLNGQWTYLNSNGSLGGNFNANSAVLNAGNLANTGDYVFEYKVSSALGLCPDASTNLTITINPLPVADAGSDVIITCANQDGDLGGSATSTGADFAYAWSFNGNQVGQSKDLLNVSDTGSYTLMVTNTLTGCTQTDLVKVTSQGSIISNLDLSIDSIYCNNGADGSIDISAVIGGVPPYSFKINGSSSNPPFNNLSPGNYVIEVSDGNGCSKTENVSLINPQPESVDLGDSFTMIQGDTKKLTAVHNFPVNEVAEISWISDPPAESCDNCPTLDVSPLKTTTYTVTVRDIYGCFATDEITIRVESVIRIYVPNAFSPNHDGINDQFYISADQNIEKINKMYIYNRWGDIQFDQTDILPNDPTVGWDGTFNGKDNDPAVFVYWAEIQFIDGRTEVLKGSFTLVR